MLRSLLSREDRTGVLALRRREGLGFLELSAETGIGEATLRVWQHGLVRRHVGRRPRVGNVLWPETPKASGSRSQEG